MAASILTAAFGFAALDSWLEGRPKAATTLAVAFVVAVGLLYGGCG